MKKSLSSVLKPFLQVIFYYQHQYYSPLPLMTATGISQRSGEWYSDEHVAAA
jgi:hypothetical protein